MTTELTHIEKPAMAVKAALEQLAVATTDQERLWVANQAEAAQAAAKVLLLPDIEVAASEVVARAKRAIAVANPAMSAQEAGAIGAAAKSSPFSRERATSTDGTTEKKYDLSPQKIRKLRSLYGPDKFSDDEFEAKITEAKEKRRPITPAYLNSKPKAEPNAEPKPAVDPQKIKKVNVITQTPLELQLETANEMVKWLSSGDDPREKMVRDQLDLIATLKTQVAEWQLKFEEVRRQNYGLRKRLEELEATPQSSV